MINKRLVSYLKEDKKYVYLQVLMQWLGLIAQIIIIVIIPGMVNELYSKGKINYFYRTGKDCHNCSFNFNKRIFWEISFSVFF